MNELSNEWLNFLASLGVEGEFLQFVTLVSIFVLALLCSYLCNRILIPVIHQIVQKTRMTWDNYLLDEKVLKSLARLIPPLLIYLLLPLAFHPSSIFLKYMRMFTLIYIVAVTVRFVQVVITSTYELTNHKGRLQGRPLLGVFQMLRMIVLAVGLIIIFSILLNKDPSKLLTGLGASAAILMVVFKDTIMGLVAGVQLSTYDMLRPGDWISMPKFGIDGNVLDVTLNTVKVRNWDNTVSTLPPYVLVSDSFQNWRGMEESAGRRIKRSINIDMLSIRFCTDEELKSFSNKGWLDEQEACKKNVVNLHVFCSYMEDFLRKQSFVNSEMTLMVRQLQPGPEGLPIELYFFSSEKDWIPYEKYQSEVFEHLFAVVGEFGLRIYQRPSGWDLV